VTEHFCIKIRLYLLEQLRRRIIESCAEATGIYVSVESSQDELIQIMTDSYQQLMQLPFEIMRQHLESVMFRQLETATSLYSKQAKDLDHAFNKHVDRFEATVKTRLEKVNAVAPANDI